MNLNWKKLGKRLKCKTMKKHSTDSDVDFFGISYFSWKLSEKWQSIEKRFYLPQYTIMFDLFQIKIYSTFGGSFWIHRVYGNGSMNEKMTLKTYWCTYSEYQVKIRLLYVRNYEKGQFSPHQMRRIFQIHFSTWYTYHLKNTFQQSEKL